MLERIWQKNQAILRSIVYNVVVDPADVEDVLQEAFTKLLRCDRRFASEEEAYNYVRRVVLNTSIDYYRSFKRRSARLAEYTDGDSWHAADKRENPLIFLMQKERVELHNSILGEIHKTLGELPPEQKEAIELVFNRNHEKIRDLCRERGIPYSTLRSRLTAGIDRIRARLKAKGFYRSYKEVE